MKKIKMLTFTLLFAIIFIYSSSADSFSNVLSIANNQKKILDYNPNEYRRMYAFHDYGSELPFDDAKFHGESYGFDKNYVYMQYKSSIGNNAYVYKSSLATNGKKASATSEAKYDYFKAGSYLKVEGSKNLYKIVIE